MTTNHEEELSFSPPPDEPENPPKLYGPVGLGGWLILIAIHVIGSILATIGALALYLPLIPEVNASPEEYPSGLFAVLVFDLLIFLAFLAVEIFQLVCFFKKRRLFPKIYIGLSLAYIAWPLLDAGSYWLVAPDEPVFDPDTIKALVRSIGSALIWISYMLQSKRVANTFVN